MDWIKVEDGLPIEEKKQGVQVICYYINFRTETRVYRIIGTLYYKGGKFYYNHVGNVEKEVTHWQPMPKKPKK